MRSARKHPLWGRHLPAVLFFDQKELHFVNTFKDSWKIYYGIS
jgi:hypothetical protein